MSSSNNMFIKRKRERDCVCVSEKERFPEGEYEINNISHFHLIRVGVCV